MVDSFVHLHTHTEYSMLDGAAKNSKLFAEVERQGMPAIAMTDAETARQAVLEAEADAAAMATGVPAVAPGEADSVSIAEAVTDTNGQPAMDTAITAALAEAGATPAVADASRPLPRPRRIAAVAPTVAEPAAA